MKPRTVSENLKPLLRAHSFTTKDAKRVGVDASLLAYYMKKGEIERIARGVYRGIKAPQEVEMRWEETVAAVKATKGGVVCLISALEMYGLTEEIPRAHWIAVRNNTRHRGGRHMKIVRLRNMELGKTEFDVGGGVKIPIFDRERCIVDAFRYLSLEVAIKALRAGLRLPRGEKVNLIKLQEYAKKLRASKRMSPYIVAETT